MLYIVYILTEHHGVLKHCSKTYQMHILKVTLQAAKAMLRNTYAYLHHEKAAGT